MREAPIGLDPKLKTSVELRVAYGEVDRMGFAYYGNYLRWFEMSRAEYLRQRGKTYKKIEEEGLVLPVLEAHVLYRRAAHYDDLLQVWSAPVKIGKVRFRYGYQITRKEDGALIAEGYTEHACLDEHQQICRLPEELVRLISNPPVEKQS